MVMQVEIEYVQSIQCIPCYNGDCERREGTRGNCSHACRVCNWNPTLLEG